MKRIVLAALFIWLTATTTDSLADSIPSTTLTTSTSHHETRTREDLADLDAYVWNVTSRIASDGACGAIDEVAFATTATGPVDGQDYSGALRQARRALVEAAVEFGCGNLCIAVSNGAPANGQTETAAGDASKVSELLVETTQIITVQQTIGPADILVGDDHAVHFHVAAGTVNFNANTHFEAFITDYWQRTITHTTPVAIIGTITPGPCVPILADIVAEAAPRILTRAFAADFPVTISGANLVAGSTTASLAGGLSVVGSASPEPHSVVFAMPGADLQSLGAKSMVLANDPGGASEPLPVLVRSRADANCSISASPGPGETGVDVRDAIDIRRLVAGLVVDLPEGCTADANGDGDLTTLDGLSVLRVLAGLDPLP